MLSWIFYTQPSLSGDLCTKFHLSMFIFIFINCFQLLTDIDSWWQLIWKKFNWNFCVYTKVDMCAKFQLSWLIFIFINRCQQLTGIYSWWQLIWKNLTGIFVCTLKLICVPNFSSPGWFSFSSIVIRCYQLLTADDNCHEKKFNGIFIYSLKLIPVPNFSSPGCLGAQLESVTPDRRTDRRTDRQTDRRTDARWIYS